MDSNTTALIEKVLGSTAATGAIVTAVLVYLANRQKNRNDKEIADENRADAGMDKMVDKLWLLITNLEKRNAELSEEVKECELLRKQLLAQTSAAVAMAAEEATKSEQYAMQLLYIMNEVRNRRGDVVGQPIIPDNIIYEISEYVQLTKQRHLTEVNNDPK